jgi:hypothetical protein
MSWTRLTHLTLGILVALVGAALIVAGPATGHLLVAGVVLVTAGAALAASGVVPRLRPGRRGWVLVTLTAVVGTLASLLVDVHGIQAQWDIYHLRGYPWSWLEHHDWYSVLGLPPDRREWTFDLAHFLADLVFWGCVGLLLITVVRLLRARRGTPGGRSVTPAA